MKTKTNSQLKKGGAFKSSPGYQSKSNMLQKGSGYASGVSKAPVKKIPNVHSSFTGSTGYSGAPMDPVTSRQLLQERQRNKILQVSFVLQFCSLYNSLFLVGSGET